jgi:membrane-associated PAP2 superfamily phosphatase
MVATKFCFALQFHSDRMTDLRQTGFIEREEVCIDLLVHNLNKFSSVICTSASTFCIQTVGDFCEKGASVDQCALYVVSNFFWGHYYAFSCRPPDDQLSSKTFISGGYELR